MKSKTNLLPIIIIAVLVTALIVCCALLFVLNQKKNAPREDPNPQAPTTTEATLVVTESVDYTIEKDELSFENTQRDLYLTQYFEKVVITDKGESFENINALIQKESDKFINEAKGNESFVKDEEYLSNMRYSNFYSATVTKNSDGVLSIKMSGEWFMGGVFNADSHGLNYDLVTGKELDIAQYLGLTKSETEKYFKEESKKRIEEGFFEDAAKTIDSYSLADFNYYLQDDSIYLCHPTYSLAPGAAGAIIMQIPLPDNK